MRHSLAVAWILVLATGGAAAFATEVDSGPVAGLDSWWTVPYPRPYNAAALPSGLDFVRVDDNRFVDEAGETLEETDPDKLDRQGRWSRAFFEWVGEAPLEMEGISYVSRPYPQKALPPWEEQWGEGHEETGTDSP